MRIHTYISLTVINLASCVCCHGQAQICPTRQPAAKHETAEANDVATTTVDPEYAEADNVATTTADPEPTDAVAPVAILNKKYYKI